MSTPIGKRPLPQSTPSPNTEQVKKVPKMTDTTQNPPGTTGLFAHSQVTDNSQVTHSQEAINLFFQIFGTTEDKALGLNSGEEKWEFVVKSLKSLSEEIGSLRKENFDLKNSLQSAKGKIIKLENKLEHCQTKMMELEWSGIQKNIVIYNVDEIANELCSRVVADILMKVFKIREEDIKTTENPSGLIEIDTAYRIGRPSGLKGRPIIVKFTTYKGKEAVMKKVRGSKSGSKIRVSDQYPPAMKEKRMAQIEDLKQYRELYSDSGKKVALIKDKLMVGSQVVQDAFEKNKLPSLPSSNPPSLDLISQTEVVEIKGSRFKGFSAKVNSVRHTAEVREALFQSQHVAVADHTLYAYIVTDDTGMKITGHSDDGEWSASKILLNKLLENKQENTFLAVSRIHAGPNLGKQRFNIIANVASDALKLLK